MSLKIVFAIGAGVCLFIKVNAQATVIDSGNIQTNSSEIVYKQVIANKSKYIGKPLDSLFRDVTLKIDFSSPDNQGSLLKGTAYYKSFSLYIISSQKLISPLDIVIKNKVFVDLEDMRNRQKDGTWVKKLKALLKNEVVVALE